MVNSPASLPADQPVRPHADAQLQDMTWLERIRCPQFFDFDAALTVPCPVEGDVNPPLRDSVYESDDETRSFFRSLETDSPLNHTPHLQQISPPPHGFQSIRPVHRHRPATSFDEYLTNFQEADLNGRSYPHPPNDSTENPKHVPGDSKNQRSPASGSDLGHRRRPTHRAGIDSESETDTTPTSNPILMQAPEKKSSTPSRFKAQAGTAFHERGSSTQRDLAPPRRPKLPERVTPPLPHMASASSGERPTSAKSRPAILRTNTSDGRHGRPLRAGQRSHSAEQRSRSKDSDGIAATKAKDVEPSQIAGQDSDFDPEIIRMVREHNRRIQQTQSQNKENHGKRASSFSDAKDYMLRNDRNIPGGAEGRRKQTEMRAHSNGGQALRQGRTGRGKIGDSGNVVLPERGQRKKPRKERNKPNDGGFSNQINDASCEDSITMVPSVKQQCRSKSSLSSQQLRNLSGNVAGKTDALLLDELLQNENNRIIEDRRRRLPERKRVMHDKKAVLKTFESQPGQSESGRVQPKVEFTSARGRDRAAGLSAEAVEERASNSKSKRPQNSIEEKPSISRSRSRGFQSLRENSQKNFNHSDTGAPLSCKSNNSGKMTSSQGTTSSHNSVKALDKNSRQERMLEEDLQTLLLEHNSRVQLRRRHCPSSDR